MYGLERSLYKSLMVVCGGEVVVVAVHNDVVVNDVVATVDVAAMDGVVVTVGDMVVTIVWVQRCWMRACTSPQSCLVSMVVALRGKKLAWWYQKTTQGPHSTMGRLVCCQPWC